MKRLLLAVCVLLMNACAKDIVVLTGELQGVVKDFETGRFVSNCEVSVQPGGYSCLTNDNGAWSFSALAPGEYTLTFIKAGYNNESRSTQILTGQLSTVDILLKAKAAFALSETAYNFGDYSLTKTFTCFNNSDVDCSYTIKNLPNWAICDKKGGVVAAGSNDTFTITLNRDNLSIGEHTHNIAVEYNGRVSGTANLLIEAQKVVLTTPTVSIAPAATNITKDRFDIEATLVATGGSQVTSYGFCWGTTSTSLDQKSNLGVKSELGAFKGTITGLDYNTTYYVKAYAQNAQGIAYSEAVAVTTQDVASDKWDGTMASSFAGGTGTKANPYLIETGSQLILMKKYTNQCFRLTQNINLNNIGWPSFDFSGTLDGNGFIISNLKVVKNGDYQGLFAILTGNVHNLTISGVSIEAEASNYVGGLAGCFKSGSVVNCRVAFVDGSRIVGNENVGGLFGGILQSSYENPPTLTKCGVSGVATQTQINGVEYVGGLVGYCYSSKFISECSVAVNVLGSTIVGGVMGGIQPSSNPIILEKCSYVGKIFADSDAGGIFGTTRGYGSWGEGIVECKAEVEMFISDDNAAGLVALPNSTSKTVVEGSYATGTITCDNSNAKYLGGLVSGHSHASINHCYSTVVCDAQNFQGLGGFETYNNLHAMESASVMPDSHSGMENCELSATNITDFMRGCYSEFASYWNFNSSWTWTGKVNGVTKSVLCPKLAWEE
ncbi:MAG: carboxypeptidase regulatory-like domain-containing protein [Rikenellaceae bacterium]|nr:carboxypeptidase regulatory-like domain-containing protein [Rikenellaceae bacterium]